MLGWGGDGVGTFWRGWGHSCSIVKWGGDSAEACKDGVLEHAGVGWEQCWSMLSCVLEHASMGVGMVYHP